MEPKTDYGKLYSSKEFKNIFPDFKRHQQAAAEKLWKRVFARCGIDPGMPQINTIVDLGCGSGILTATIAKQAAIAGTKSKPPRKIRTIGIDCSDEAIKLARSNCRKIKAHCDFHAKNLPLPKLFQWLKADENVNWTTTALVCLSHTWFHFDQTEILEVINRHRPALLLIDVFDSWDAAVKEVRAKREVLEEGRPAKAHHTHYFLKTAPLKKGMIKRGIWKVTRSGADWMFREYGFPTQQHDRLTTELFGKELIFDNSSTEDPVELLRKARNQGDLTGEDKCDYIARKQIAHHGGWGQMQCHVLVPRNQPARPVNEAYFEQVRTLVRNLFVEKSTKKPFTHLRELLNLFNEPAHWTRRTKFPGSREAIVVLPFDPITTFGRMVGLFPKAVDTEINKHDLIFERANQVQQRYPTGSGGFHTMEDRVSSPQAFPLNWATDYDHSAADWAYARLETVLLGLRKSGEPADHNSFGKDEPLGYFFAPVYFGSLPLFALILKFPNFFDVAATDFQVYLSSLSNLLSAIKVELTTDRIQLELVRPWLAKTLEQPLGSEKDGDAIANHLDEIEKMLFGEPVAHSEVLETQNRGGGIVNKDWKSWLLGIPSYPIKNLRSVKAENERLWRIWQREREHFEMDHELRLSEWFQEGKFFEKCHDAYDPKKDPKDSILLGSMLERAGFPVGRGREAVIGYLEIIANDVDQDGNPIGRGNERVKQYFSSSENHFLFRWMCKQLLKLLTGDKGAQTEAHLDLKAMFCKSLGNNGCRVRYGCRRLWCLLEAASGQPPLGKKPGRAAFEKVDAKYWSFDDPSLHLAEFVHSLTVCRNRDAALLKHVEFTADPNTGCSKITVFLERTLSGRKGGESCERIRQRFEEVVKYEEEGGDVFNRLKFTFDVVVAIDKRRDELIFHRKNRK